MTNLTPKKIYEKIVLHGHTPTPEELQVLENTPWKHKLNGTKPEKVNMYHRFKSFFKEEGAASSSEPQSRAAMASAIVDRVEDQFGLHFSDVGVNPIDNAKLPEIKAFILKQLTRCNGATGDIKTIAKAVDRAEDIAELMIRLNYLSS